MSGLGQVQAGGTHSLVVLKVFDVEALFVILKCFPNPLCRYLLVSSLVQNQKNVGEFICVPALALPLPSLFFPEPCFVSSAFLCLPVQLLVG